MKNKDLLPPRADSFTLIELSIVLFIIGLIVGGVLVGKDLIRSAQVMGVWDEVQDIKTAINIFSLKYNCIPGDCNNAESFWGSDGSCPTTAANSTAKQETCNGNGDKKIGDWSGSSSVSGMRYEWYRLWQHLANAGLIKGQYSGTPGALGDYDCVSPSNCWVSKLEGGRYRIIYVDLAAGTSSLYPMLPGHYLSIGLPVGGSGNPIGAIFTPLDAFQLDTKYDDGKPGTGSIVSRKQGDAITPNCASSTTASTATYRTDLDTKECSLYIKVSIGSF